MLIRLIMYPQVSVAYIVIRVLLLLSSAVKTFNKLLQRIQLNFNCILLRKILDSIIDSSDSVKAVKLS